MSTEPPAFPPEAMALLDEKPAKSAWIGMGCLMLFLLPFVVGGIVMFVFGLSTLPDTSTEEGPVLLFIGSAFTVLGSVGMYSLVSGGSGFIQRVRLQQKHPGEPWLWREDWAQRTITDGSKGRMIAGWVVAVIFGAAAAAASRVLADNLPGLYAESPIFTTLALCVAGGVLLLIFAHATHATMQWLKYGASTLHLSRVPCLPGESISGRVETTFREAPPEGCSVELKCNRVTTTGSGKNRRTHTRTVFSDVVQLDSFRLGYGPSGIYVPVDCRVPETAESTCTSGNRQTHWKLVVKASMPGADYYAEFALPVFRAGSDGKAVDSAM